MKGTFIMTTAIVAAALGIAACISIAFVQSLKPVSAGAYLFWSLWLVAPYIALGAVVFLARGEVLNSVIWQIATLAISVAGPLLLVDAVLWRPDAQGGIAVLMVPIAQLAIAIVAVPVAWLVRRIRNGREARRP